MLIRMLTFSVAKVGVCNSDKRISDRKTRREVAVAAPISSPYVSKEKQYGTAKKMAISAYIVQFLGPVVGSSNPNFFFLCE